MGARRDRRDRRVRSSQSHRAGETSLEELNGQMDEYRSQDPAYFGGNANEAAGVAATSAAADHHHPSNLSLTLALSSRTDISNTPVQVNCTDAMSQSVTTTPPASMSHQAEDN